MHSRTQYAAIALVLALAAIPIGATHPSQANPQPSTPSPPTATPTPLAPVPLEERVAILEAQVSQDQSLIAVQSNSFGAAIARVESSANLVLIVLAIAALIAALLGFGIVRGWVSSLVQERLEKISREDLDRTIQAELTKLRLEWDGKFAELYEEYRGSLRK